MKNSPLTTVLLAITALSAVLSLVFCGLFISNSRQLNRVRTAITAANNNRGFINQLASDMLEYSKKNQAIDPLLEWIGAKPAKAAEGAPSNKPAGK